MSWFTRKQKGIVTPTAEKKETPDGLWYKTPSGEIIETKVLEENDFVTPNEGYHVRIGSKEYFTILFDNAEYLELDGDLKSGDPLGFEDTKKYKVRIEETIKKTGLNDAVASAYGKSNGHDLVISCMDFAFIGGSMGSVVGEKISRAILYAIEKKCPFMMISKSGGARMMEAGFSLMQMAKTSARLTQLADAQLPYISYITDPTTGGITASFAMLGDVNIAEPGALIGFAGPRVVRDTVGKDLPKGFQTSEFLLEHGFVDFIVDRRNLKEKMGQLMNLFKN
jgi:acetyl-CoA carboxylase carboxyl transferase subunit beta